MRRFYLESIFEGIVELDREQASHARKALRILPGDPTEVFDGRGLLGRGRVVESKREVLIEIASIEMVKPERPAVTIVSAVPKGDRAATLVEKLSELGCDAWVPLRTKYSVVDPRPGKLERFRRITIESAKQSGRAHLMRVGEVADFSKMVQLPTQDSGKIYLMADVPDKPGDADPLASVLQDALAGGSGGAGEFPDVTVLVGPEGGWSDEERAKARQFGWKSWSFGNNVLRVETAGISACSIVKYVTMVNKKAFQDQREE